MRTGNPAAMAQFAVRKRAHLDRWRDEPGHDRQDDAGQTHVQGLLHAAGMAATDDTDSAIDVNSTGAGGRGLPLVELLDARSNGSRYCVTTTIDDRGRLADRTPLKVLGWAPGAAVTVSMVHNAGIILVRARGSDAVTRQGHLRLSANVRHGCRIHTGDRLLVVAHTTEDVLVAYTPFALDAMTSAYHATLSAKELA